MVKHTFLFFVLLSLFGCSNWPPPSKGGYAAHYLFNPHHFRCTGIHSICQVNTNRLAHDVCELDALRGQHAAKCYSARYTSLRLLGQQIAQEIAAQLYLSAQLDLNLFEMNLRQLQQLNNPDKGCRRIKTDKGWELLKLRIQ